MSSSSLPQPQKRACDVCYNRKIQCVLSDPDGPCEWCTHRSLDCTFDRQRPRKKPRGTASSQELQTLSNRIDQLERELAQVRSTQSRSIASETPGVSLGNDLSQELPPRGTKRARYSSHSERPSVPSVSAETPTENPPGSISDQHVKVSRSSSQLGPNWFFNKMPITSEAGCRWLAARTGQDISGNEFDIPGFKVPPSSILSSSLQNTCELPNQDLLRTMLEKIFNPEFEFGREFPILNQASIEKTIETAYTPVDGNGISSVQLSARTCLLCAISFLSTHIELRVMLGGVIDLEHCTSEAQRLFFFIQGDTSLETLQAALFLGLQQSFQGLWQDAALYHSIACRIVCSLKGHIYCAIPHILPENLDAEEQKNRHTRVLFWLCYMLDKDIALRTGNPPYLTEAFCDLETVDSSPFCSNYPLESSDNGSTNQAIHGGDIRWQFLPEDPHLSPLKETIFLELFSAEAMKQSDGRILARIRELDNRIEVWRMSLHPDLRPSLSMPPNAVPHEGFIGLTHWLHRMPLYLSYYHLMTIVHTTVRRCSVEYSEELHHVVHSSFDLALEASRSTIWGLDILLNYSEDAFRFITSYLTTATTALFLNIVIHPLDKQAHRDLELLVFTANMIRNIPEDSEHMKALTQREVHRMQEITKFVMRLVWLGSCAVNKAEGENTTNP
ncbi:hypothetical protein N7493_011855 [Penicillium malachiteum]|uniref:Zn(2)-C6 fungal-type domain-containing protein n=1 Tax=Penicillium malachiteum TaxID=1324776 RepID=A0AAD6HAK0_9EURO|nr:hypothetical protein N7493_011855 [Penicillium malachiteum]